MVLSTNVPKEVDALLCAYQKQILTTLPNQIYGIYLYGSIALNAYDSTNSDIDIIVLLHASPIEAGKQTITHIHQSLASVSSLAKRIDGMYIPVDYLGKQNDDVSPYLYVTDGKVRLGKWDLNAITWWMLKQYGITIYGPESKELNIDISWDDVIQTLDYNLNHYWRRKSNGRLPYMLDDVRADAVCTMCRIMYSLEHQHIAAKVEAVQYVMNKLPEKWHPLLLEAIAVREGHHKPQSIVTRWARAKQTQAFLRLMIAQSSQTYLYK
ncbi:aminoglycoside adenylyltransferase domain-containing protein [Paenibacillus assamensis]|uniref:aminoglycoside adenylyltransferase domain-containing protein n=1 Tax=Paenibacillus assamensis TaxID=311244 RepID=UPI0003FCFA41|nr:aminoglycoside adenylyltransferase domain-containing protein [Paenibacillus assamensis]